MIAYGTCIGSQDKYQKYAALGVSRHASEGCPVATSTGNTSILEAYNEMLDAFVGLPDLEALVLLHEDLEIRDPGFEREVRTALADPGVAVLGVVGATEVRGLEWWQGTGAGRCLETRGTVEFERRSGTVEAVDGLVLVLSAWAVEHLRFDTSTFSGFHAYDVDLCFQARRAGKTIRLLDVDVFHHTKGGFGDEVGFRLADAAFRVKWGLPPGPVPGDPQCPVCAVPLVAGPQQADHHVALCPRCRLGATLPSPECTAVTAASSAGQDGGPPPSDRPQRMRAAQVRAAWLQQHLPDGSVLALAGDSGELVAALDAHAYDAYGVGPIARHQGAAPELTARDTTGELVAWREEHPGWLVDAVVAVEVLERVAAPRRLLAEAAGVLSPDGLLLLEVHNFDSVLARRHTAHWTGGLRSGRRTHHTEQSLHALLEQEGFQVLSSLPMSVRPYDDPATWRSRRTAWRGAGLPQVPLDLLRIVARRASVP